MPISEVKGRWLPSTPPTSSAVPAATQKNQHYEDDDEKCRGVHVALVLSENSIRPGSRIVRQNHRIIDSDACDPACARNVRGRPV